MSPLRGLCALLLIYTGLRPCLQNYRRDAAFFRRFVPKGGLGLYWPGGWVGRARPTTLNVSAVGAGFLLGMGRGGEFVEVGVECEVEEDGVRAAGGCG